MPAKRGPGTSFYAPIAYTNDQAIFQISPSSLNKTPTSTRRARWSFDPGLRRGLPDGAFESEDLPDPPGMGFIRLSNRCHPARDGGLDLAALSERGKCSRIPADQGTSWRQVLAGRKPLFVLRFDGAFLLRFAERTFAG